MRQFGERRAAFQSRQQAAHPARRLDTADFEWPGLALHADGHAHHLAYAGAAVWVAFQKIERGLNLGCVDLHPLPAQSHQRFLHAGQRR